MFCVCPVVPNGDGVGCGCPVFPNCGTTRVVPDWTGVIVEVEPVPGCLNPKENLGVLSAGLGGSDARGVLVVVVAPAGLRVEAGFVVLRVEAEGFIVCGPSLAASDGTLVVEAGVAVDWGCLGCSAGLGIRNGEGPEVLPPTPGKANIGFVVPVPGVVAGVGWVTRVGNVDIGFVVVLETLVVVCGGTGGLAKKLGAVLVAVVEGSDFVAGVGGVGVAGLTKKFGTTGCVGVGTLLAGVVIGVGVANKFFAGSFVSVIPVAIFGCVGTAGAGADKLGVVVLALVVVTGVGAGDGESFFSSSAAFFVS